MLKIRYNSPLILTFTLICFGILFISQSTGNTLILQFFTALPDMSVSDPLTWWRIFSHVMGHKDWTHFMGNFTFILLIGPVLEERYGTKRLLIMIITAACITGILNTLLFSHGLFGSSSIVFMFIVLVSFTNFRSGDIPLTFICIILIFLTREVYDSFQQDSISQFAHIIGGICGTAFGFRYNKS